MFTSKLTHKRLTEVLYYEPLTGLFKWRISPRPRTPIGSVAGGKIYRYLRIKIDCVLYQAHRLAWFYVYGIWPIDQLDHINGIKSDNRLVNLRESTASQNGRNRGLQSNNRSGVKGVWWHTRDKAWHVRAWVNGVGIHLGCFKKLDEATKARLDFVAEKYEGFLPLEEINNTTHRAEQS